MSITSGNKLLFVPCDLKNNIMKKLIAILILLLHMSVSAQSPQGMDQEQMQHMIVQMQKMQACVKDLDQSGLQALGIRAKQMNKEVEALCAKGERDGAQQKALAFVRETVKNPSLQKIRKCGDPLEGMMPEIPLLDQYDSKGGNSNQHICDQ